MFVLSVIIPALNEEKYLPNLLKDLEVQTEKDFEVIVVDGKSEDKTKEKAEEFADKLPLRVIVSSRRNVSFQRNIGAKSAKGSYLFFLDADSRIEENTIEKIKKYIEREKKPLYVPYVLPSRSNIINNFHFTFLTRVVILLDKLGKSFALGAAIIIQKEFFEKIGGFDEKAYVSEDQNLIMKSRDIGVRPRYMPDVSYSYSMRRFESGNWFVLMAKYTLYTLITFFKGVVYTDIIKYDFEMGGKKYENKDTKRKVI